MELTLGHVNPRDDIARILLLARQESHRQKWPRLQICSPVALSPGSRLYRILIDRQLPYLPGETMRRLTEFYGIRCGP